MGAGRQEILADGGRRGCAALNATTAIQAHAGAELRLVLSKEVHEASPPFVLGKGHY